MTVEQTVIEETDLRNQQTEPSERFARLFMRVGERTGVGSLGLGVIRENVRRSVGDQ